MLHCSYQEQGYIHQALRFGEGSGSQQMALTAGDLVGVNRAFFMTLDLMTLNYAREWLSITLVVMLSYVMLCLCNLSHCSCSSTAGTSVISAYQCVFMSMHYVNPQIAWCTVLLFVQRMHVCPLYMAVKAF